MMYLHVKSITGLLCSLTAALTIALTSLSVQEVQPVPNSTAQESPSGGSEMLTDGNSYSGTDNTTDASDTTESMSAEDSAASAESEEVTPSDESEDKVSENITNEPTQETEESSVSADLEAAKNVEEEDNAQNFVVESSGTSSVISELLESSAPPITADLAMLLATNQADSIMGNLGLVRSEQCHWAETVFYLDEFRTADTLDENYTALWGALQTELSKLAAQGYQYANCTYEDGVITVWRENIYG